MGLVGSKLLLYTFCVKNILCVNITIFFIRGINSGQQQLFVTPVNPNGRINSIIFM